MNKEFEPDVIVVGAGYVGLTLSLHLASKKLKVLAIDINKEAVKSLQKGESTIFENSIVVALKNCIKAGNLKFSTNPPANGCNYWIIAISYFPGDKSHYLKVLDIISGVKNNSPTIMIRGTIPVGYLSKTLLPELEKKFNSKVDENFFLASAPERSLSGAALEELEDLPQIIAGSFPSFKRASLIFEKSGIECIHLSILEAGEIAKTFTNFARLVQFNLSNYLGALCHEFGISEEIMFQSVKEGYPRLNFLSKPGPGVGGFCLPKDSLVLYDGVSELGEKYSDAAEFIDFPKQQFLLNKSIITTHSKLVLNLVKDKTNVLALGMAFKGEPKTDDIRDSVGVFIVNKLVESGISVTVYDLVVNGGKLRNEGFNILEKFDDISQFDAILLLNNDRNYGCFIQKYIYKTNRSTISLYDPWRLIVTGNETIFQETFPINSFKR